MGLPPTIERRAPEVWWQVQPLYEAGEYAEAADRGRELLEAYPENGYLLYNVACCESLAGRTAAVEHLGRDRHVGARPSHGEGGFGLRSDPRETARSRNWSASALLASCEEGGWRRRLLLATPPAHVRVRRLGQVLQRVRVEEVAGAEVGQVGVDDGADVLPLTR